MANDRRFRSACYYQALDANDGDCPTEVAKLATRIVSPHNRSGWIAPHAGNERWNSIGRLLVAGLQHGDFTMAKYPMPTEQELQNQIMDLKAEIVELSRIALERAGDAADMARHEGLTILAAVKEDPKTATSIALTAGLLGVAIGWLLGTASGSQQSRWHF
jgi:hypothetical protein